MSQWVKTQDGSYTQKDTFSEELMHNVSGAWSETCHVFMPALEILSSLKKEPITLLIFGTGLGYIDLLVGAFSLKYSIKFKVLSFEKEDSLRESLICELKNKSFPYDELFQTIATQFEIDVNQLSEKVLEQTSFLGAYQTSLVPYKIDGMLFDAFSSSVDDTLWSEVFLKGLLEQMSDSSVFVTYAARGGLNRVLKESGFEKKPRKGFGRKREMTFALRGF